MKQDFMKVKLNLASFASIGILSFFGFTVLPQKLIMADSGRIFVSHNPITTRFSLEADQCWVGTGLYLYGSDNSHISDAIHIRAYGTWSNGGDNPQFVDASGFRNYSHPGQMLNRADFASLIGRLGANGMPFSIGKTGVAMLFSGSGEGQLYLSINDVNGTCGDNIGSLDVWLTSGEMVPAVGPVHVPKPYVGDL